MRNIFALVVSSVLCAQAFAVYEVGDTVKNMCWRDAKNQQVCLDDNQAAVRVLLYNTGWCGPCNEEFNELAPRVSEFAGKPVQFLSLSAQGWTGGSAPTSQFLNEWQQKHGITFPVLASPRDAGVQFGQQYIPNVAIVDTNNKLTYKAVAPGVDAIFSAVNSALGQ